MVKVQKILAAVILIIISLNTAAYSITNQKIKQKRGELTDVNKQLDNLNTKLEIAVEDYNQARQSVSKTKTKIDEVKSDINKTVEELKYNQNILNKRASDIYINGKPTFIEVFFSATDYIDLLNLLDYYNRIVNQDKKAIKQIRKSKIKLNYSKDKMQAQLAKHIIELDNVSAKKEKIVDTVNMKKLLLNEIKGQLKDLQRQERERLERIKEQALKKLAQSNISRAAPNAKVVDIAKNYLGVKYTWGGENPQTGFDCSGLTSFCYMKIGVYIPRTSAEQYRYLVSKNKKVNESDLLPGDLVFYGRGRVSHVAIYMGEGYIIGASGGQYISGEVKIQSLHYRSDYIGAARP